jgi:phosphoglycerate kinase
VNLPDVRTISKSTVFLHADLDVPIVKDSVQSTYRIDRCLETINILLQNDNKVYIFGKIGRPKKKEKELSTHTLIPALTEKIGECFFLKNIDELEASVNMSEKLFIYENTRFFKWENHENKDKTKKISSIFDWYVDEAFALSHRTESSNYHIPKQIGKYTWGINYKNEVATLTKIRSGEFSRPSLFILGGAKADTKIPMIENIADRFTYFLVGGKLVKDKRIQELSREHKNVVPMQLDIHQKDINAKSSEILKRAAQIAKTIVWNGPVGMFEDPKYSHGTRKLLEAIAAKQKGYVLAGGGDTISAIERFGDTDKFDFISTGGGAMFWFLQGGETNIEKLHREQND